jgi:guanine nucleotide-binding protein subunit beta-like protein 1
MTIGENSITQIIHTPDELLTQEKNGLLKCFGLTNSGYNLSDELDTSHLGFCRIDVIPEKNLLVAPRNDNNIGIITIPTMKEEQLLLASNVPDRSNLGLVMSLKHIKISGQSYILAGYESGDLLTWDLRCNKVFSSAKYEECPMAIDYDDVTNRGLLGGSGDKIHVFSFARNSQEILKKSEIAIKNPGVHCLKIRKDLKIFTSGGWDGRIRIFSWKSMRPLAVLTEHKNELMDIAFSPDKVSMWNAPIMAAASIDGQITLWNIYN